jgi:hypothetical protein
MSLFSKASDVMGAVATTVSYLFTFPTDTYTNLLWEEECADDDGDDRAPSTIISLVELPESENSRFVRERDAGKFRLDPIEVKRMGGKVRELGRVTENATQEEIQKQLKQMIAPIWKERQSQGKSEPGPAGEHELNGLVSASALDIRRFNLTKKFQREGAGLKSGETSE